MATPREWLRFAYEEIVSFTSGKRLSRYRHLAESSRNDGLFQEKSVDGRTVYLDGEKLKKQRIARGWRVEDLARVAAISERSVGNAENGQKIHVNTYAKIAKALGAKAGDLMRELETPVKPGNIRVGLVIEGDLKEIANSENLSLLVTLLKKLIPATAEVELIDVKAGSVIIELELSEKDALQLLALFPDIHEHAYEAVAATPEGRAYFSHENPDNLDLSKVAFLLELALSVREMRVLAGPSSSDNQRRANEKKRASRKRAFNKFREKAKMKLAYVKRKMKLEYVKRMKQKAEKGIFA